MPMMLQVSLPGGSDAILGEEKPTSSDLPQPTDHVRRWLYSRTDHSIILTRYERLVLQCWIQGLQGLQILLPRTKVKIRLAERLQTWGRVIPYKCSQAHGEVPVDYNYRGTNPIKWHEEVLSLQPITSSTVLLGYNSCSPVYYVFAEANGDWSTPIDGADTMMLRQSGDIHRLTPEGCPVHLLHLFSGFQKGFPPFWGGDTE